MPNVKNINRIIELLKMEEMMKHFDMRDTISGEFFEHGNTDAKGIDDLIKECGSTACILGLIALETRQSTPDCDNGDYLGISYEQSQDLFYPCSAFQGDEKYSPIYETNPLKVVPVLEHLRDTGELDWRKALEV